MRSELTARNPYRMPFLVETADAARLICDGVADGKPMVRFPWPIAAAVRLLTWLPIGLYDRIAVSALDQRSGNQPKATCGGEG